ncbi:MAG: class I SAM-dependent methyltransferase [Anaerolineales bacterium]
MTNFDQRAKDWDSDPQKAERARAVAQAIRQAIPLTRQMSALEYGCGTGLLSFALQADLGNIALADSSTGMLAALAEKIRAAGISHMQPLRLDLAADPLPAQRYDVLYSLMTLHHIPNTAEILSKFHALLRPNGYLLIADLDKEDGSFHAKGAEEVHHGFARASLQAQVEAAGFRGVKFAVAYEIKKKIGAEEKTFPVFLLSAQA